MAAPCLHVFVICAAVTLSIGCNCPATLRLEDMRQCKADAEAEFHRRILSTDTLHSVHWDGKRCLMRVNSMIVNDPAVAQGEGKTFTFHTAVIDVYGRREAMPAARLKTVLPPVAFDTENASRLKAIEVAMGEGEERR
jgi:hypothetical protein